MDLFCKKPVDRRLSPLKRQNRVIDNKHNISAIFPVWNGKKNLAKLRRGVRHAFESIGSRYEMPFVDDEGRDGSLEDRGIGLKDP